MAFGMIVHKWGVLPRALKISLKNVCHLVLALARFHNFCINKQLKQGQKPVTDNADRGLKIFQEALRRLSATTQEYSCSTAIID
jgi:hypothetical protein